MKTTHVVTYPALFGTIERRFETHDQAADWVRRIGRTKTAKITIVETTY